MSGLHEAFSGIVAEVPDYGDLDRAIRRAEQERRRRLGLLAGLSVAAVVLVVIAGVLAITRDGNGSPQPIGPPPTPTESTSAAPEWTGPVRSGVTLPVVSDQRLGPPSNPWRGLTDPRDSAVGQIDIRLLAGWGLQLREDSQLEAWLDREGRIVEYGLVVDTDGDRVADCQLALNTDAPDRGSFHYRMIVKNLHTGVTKEQGPPYGYPFEFGFPRDDGSIFASSPSVFIEFLGEWPRPCDARDGRIHWYAYASLTQNGRVTAWDFAPDAAWVQTLPRLAVEFGGRIARSQWGRGLPLPIGP